MRTKLLLSALLTAAALVTAPPAGAQARTYVVIVNAANPVSSMSRADLSRLFLKKTERWSNGAAVAPVDLEASSKVRASFTKEILGKSTASVQSFWQQQIFSGRNVPPVTKPTDDQVIAYVRANANAIGYVAAIAAAPPGTRLVVVTN